MNTSELTADAKTILLLCSDFGARNDARSAMPLTADEYNRVADWLVARGMRPADLLTMAPGNPPAAAPLPVEWDRLTALLKRGAALAFAVEKWFNSGIWVLCRSDAAYPGRLKKHLQKTAPPVLFGAGDVRLLSSGGLAIVGSPSTSPEALAFAAQISQRCAREGLTVVSGSTRGVDEAAILAALEAGGTAISVLADRLAATALSGKFRTPLRTGRLVLLSPHAPETGVSLENAPARNRLVYGLADFALVVSGALRPGSAWAGAEEELRRPSPIPVYVRLAADAPKGNHALLMLGARPFPEDLSSGPLAATLDQCHR